MSYTEIPFGLKEGKLVTVQDIPSDVHGIDCNCVCPACQKPLVIIRAKGKRTHFRHKASEMHCHYNYDEQTLNYVWDLLEKNGVVKDADLDSLQYFRISQTNDNQITKQTVKRTSNTQERNAYIEDIDKENHLMKIVVNGETFKIKLGIHSNEEDTSTIYINLKEFDFQNNPSSNDILSQLSHQITQRITKKQNEDKQTQFLQEQISKIRSFSKPQSKNNEWENLGEIVKTLPKRCPKCGAYMCKRKAKNGTVIVCSNYPTCDMTAQKLMSGEW